MYSNCSKLVSVYKRKRRERDGQTGIELIFLVPKQVLIDYFRKQEQGPFAYLNGGDTLHLSILYIAYVIRFMGLKFASLECNEIIFCD